MDTLRRKIYTELLKWKEEEAGRTALLIDGARRVGKSYIVENFAKQEYKSYIIIDFNRVNQEVTELFENYLNDLDLFFMYLSNYYNVKLYERDTLIIFDEVQLFPRARAASAAEIPAIPLPMITRSVFNLIKIKPPSPVALFSNTC